MLKFRFGVLGESATTATQLVDTASRAELLGYDTFLLRDHFVAEPFGDQLAPLLALTAIACATTTLRVGTLVIDNDYRHPAVLAKEAATLDHISGGRFELGLGAGWLREEYQRVGIPFDHAGTRVSRLEESLTVLKGLLAGDKVTFDGDHYTLSELTNFPSVARIPILIGAGSPRMLRLAGSQADAVGILAKALPDGTISDAMSERSSEGFATKAALVREAAGDREVEISTVVSVTTADDPRKAAEDYARSRGWGAEAADLVLDMPAKFLGPPEHLADLARERRRRYGLSYLVVSDRDMEAAAPMVELLSGT